VTALFFFLSAFLFFFSLFASLAVQILLSGFRCGRVVFCVFECFCLFCASLLSSSLFCSFAFYLLASYVLYLASLIIMGIFSVLSFFFFARCLFFMLVSGLGYLFLVWFSSCSFCSYLRVSMWSSMLFGWPLLGRVFVSFFFRPAGLHFRFQATTARPIVAREPGQQRDGVTCSHSSWLPARAKPCWSSRRLSART